MTGSPLVLTEEEEGEAATDQSSLPAIACRIIVLKPCFVCVRPIRMPPELLLLVTQSLKERRAHVCFSLEEKH